MSDDFTVTVIEALTMISSGGVFIDVRTPGEYEAGHIPGARLVLITDLQKAPFDAIWGHDPLAMMDPATLEKKIVVDSSTPKHAAAVTTLLRNENLQAFTLTGGLRAWVRDGQILLPGPMR